MNEDGLSKTKDGVPCYDGAADKLNLYKEEALQYLFTLEHHKRYLAGPRLSQSLTGIARTVIRKRLARDPQWLAHPRGAYDLLEHLEECIGQPTVLQAAQHTQKFFYQLKRRRNETMTSWTNRRSEALWEASRALRKVQAEQGTSASTGRGSSAASMMRSHGGWRDEEWGHSVDLEERHSNDDSGPFQDDGRMREQADEGEDAQSYSGWNWSGSEWRGWHRGSWRSEEYAPPKAWSSEVPDFLPDHLVGFLLLQRSSLDAGERANVLAAVKGDVTVGSIERALKNNGQMKICSDVTSSIMLHTMPWKRLQKMSCLWMKNALTQMTTLRPMNASWLIKP